MAKQYSTIQQHEPLRVPEGWDGDRRRLIAQLEEIFDDIYRRFGRLGMNDLSTALRQKITSQEETVEGLKTKVTEIDATAGQLVVEVSEKITKEEVDQLHSTTVDISADGVNIKTGGTFTVDSSKFDIDENGEMSAVNARISGDLSVNENAVWHKGILIVSTVTPKAPSEGMIWVKPDTTSVPAAGTWTKDALTSRPNFVRYYNEELKGVSIGTAPSNAKYRYKVKIPVYHTWNDTNAYTCTVYLGAASGAETINLGTQMFSAGGGHFFEAEVESTVWLGNLSTIWLRVVFSAGGVMALNSHSPFSCTLTAKTNSAAGWKSCEVQMYAG